MTTTYAGTCRSIYILNTTNLDLSNVDYIEAIPLNLRPSCLFEIQSLNKLVIPEFNKGLVILIYNRGNLGVIILN